jgi:iron(III) transport system ATP-binding protein
MRGVARPEREKRVALALERVGLGGFGDRRTSDMSGGQQQRVAIARAIVAEPALVLFDEPLSNLDRELRESMVSEIGELVSSLGLTAIYVTHDQSEAFSLAHQVAVMRAGVIEQLAPPEQLVDHPGSPAVAEFLRLGCVAKVQHRDGQSWVAGTNISLGEVATIGSADATHVLLPAKAVRPGIPAEVNIPGRVTRTLFRGDGHLVVAQIGYPDASIELQFLSSVKLLAGEHVTLGFDTADLRWFS